MNLALLVNSIGWTLLHFLWQGALIGVLCALTLGMLRQARPQWRYIVACASLLACLLWPAVELAMCLQGDAMQTVQMRFADAMLARRAGNSMGSTLVWLQSQFGSIVALWALCAALLTVRMALGLAWIRRTTREHQHHGACEATLASLARRFGVTRRVGLRVVNDLASPLSVGWLRPLVLVPAALLSGMPPQLLEALLAHEMAHIRRLDYLVNLGQNVIETLLFYHPAVWWISHRIRHEREQIADDLAASCTGDKRNLALALSELETMQFGQHHLAQAANGGQLLERVRRLVRPATAMPDWKAALAVMGLVAACLSVAAHASVGPHAAVPDHMPMADFGSCGKPVWPSAALAERRTGMVSLGFEIGEDGRVTNSFVRKSSGSADLDEAARAGIALCHFHPGTVRGTPVSSWTAIQYQWLL